MFAVLLNAATLCPAIRTIAEYSSQTHPSVSIVEVGDGMAEGFGTAGMMEVTTLEQGFDLARGLITGDPDRSESW